MFPNVRALDCRTSVSADYVKTRWLVLTTLISPCWNMLLRRHISQESLIRLRRHSLGWQSISVLHYRSVSPIWIWCSFPVWITCISMERLTRRLRPHGRDGSFMLLLIWALQIISGGMLRHSLIMSPVVRVSCKWDNRIMTSWFICLFMICGTIRTVVCCFSIFIRWRNVLLGL